MWVTVEVGVGCRVRVGIVVGAAVNDLIGVTVLSGVFVLLLVRVGTLVPSTLAGT